MPYCIQCGHPADLTIPKNDSRPRLCCPTCGHIHYENPKVVAGTLCIHDDKILLCRRAIEPRYGTWTLPAGFLEIGESMRDGAVRETLEEADAIATEPQLYALFDLPEFGQIHVMYLARLKDGMFGCGTESLECRLFGLDEIPWADLSFRTVIKTLEYYAKDAKVHGDTLADYPLHETVIDH
ncbi:MAG: NUDIX hydrolase [Moraxella sp.]|nr:NUDIX hydrolase [Moraxella sp.]